MSGSLDAVFAVDGPLARLIPGFQPRAEQLAMATAVAEACAASEVLLAEAGTGTGKTFAYLIPALLSGRKVIVSTGTKTLQDQLFQKDLPLVLEALELPSRIALLKGRSNYLCTQRFETALADGRFDSREQSMQLQILARWAGVTRSGDLAEAPLPALDEALQLKVSSSADNCLGADCPHVGDCFLLEARRRAQEADLLVVNHHLLLADWALKEGGFGEVLPEADVFIFDEAHQLPEVAGQFFGVSLSSRQLTELTREGLAEYQREAGDVPALAEAFERLTRAVLELRLALGVSGRRAAWAEVREQGPVLLAVEQLEGCLAQLEALLEPLVVRGKGLEGVWRRCLAVGEQLRAFVQADAAEAVPWFETYSQSFMLRLTPIDVAEPFRRRLARQQAAWVLTSATLSVGGEFDHFARRLGLDEPRTLRVDSPFDYRRNALLYVPRGLPPPTAAGYLPAFLQTAESVLLLSRGRAFVLFTSHRALRAAADYLRERLDYPLLVQGEAGQAELLERFRRAGDAVLLGTASFWEGVDVRGEALSCVIIDRLPFAAPNDPVLQARVAALSRAEVDPFMSYQLPLAVISLRQGVGRLIRDVADRGLLMIGDNRMLTRFYGPVFRASLPPMPLTRELAAVQDFFAEELLL